ncbi:MAG: type II toxin-antitoxin system VapC family toxin [Planctomycetota bacterium]
MIVYLDTSVPLRVLLRQSDAMTDWDRWREGFSSALLGVEARRTIDRFRRERYFDDERVARAHEALLDIEGRIRTIEITPRVLARAAGPMPTTVKTLDAIHIASALLLAERSSEEVIFATHDHQQTLAARALGFRVVG